MSRVTRTGIPLRVAKQEADPSGPTAIVYDLPPNFWHPSMGPREEETVEKEIDEERDAPSWLVRLGATVVASCFVAIVVAVTVRIVAWILEGM